jgi:hypothetical protein
MSNSEHVPQPSCSYARLNKYNRSTSGIPVPPGSGVVPLGTQRVPVVSGSPGYNTLMHAGDQPSCSGYATIANAYRNNGTGCNQQYRNRACQGL